MHCTVGKVGHLMCVCVSVCLYLEVSELLDDALSQLSDCTSCWLDDLCGWLNASAACHHSWVDRSVELTGHAIVVQHCSGRDQLARLLGRVQ